MRGSRRALRDSSGVSGSLGIKSICFTQPRRRQRQECHKFAYLTIKNNSSARFARAFFILGHFTAVLVQSTPWNDVFCSCVMHDANTCQQIFKFFFSSLNCWRKFNSRIVKTDFSRIMAWKQLRHDYRNAKLDFQMTFSQSSTTHLLKGSLTKRKCLA